LILKQTTAPEYRALGIATLYPAGGSGERAALEQVNGQFGENPLLAADMARAYRRWI